MKAPALAATNMYAGLEQEYAYIDQTATKTEGEGRDFDNPIYGDEVVSGVYSHTVHPDSSPAAPTNGVLAGEYSSLAVPKYKAPSATNGNKKPAIYNKLVEDEYSHTVHPDSSPASPPNSVLAGEYSSLAVPEYEAPSATSGNKKPVIHNKLVEDEYSHTVHPDSFPATPTNGILAGEYSSLAVPEYEAPSATNKPAIYSKVAKEEVAEMYSHTVHPDSFPASPPNSVLAGEYSSLAVLEYETPSVVGGSNKPAIYSKVAQEHTYSVLENN